MPDNNIQELYQELKASQSTSQNYAPFLQSMETLDSEMKALMEPDENGWKLLTPERFKSFSEKYRDAGIKLEQYLAGTASTQDPAERLIREKAEKLAALMAKDASVFRRYNPASPRSQKSLPTLLEESRIPVIDISSTNLSSVGGAQSSRVPMSFVGPDGQTMTGVFTRASYFDPLGKFNRAAEKAANQPGVTPQGADLLKNFMSAYKTYYTQNADPKKPVSNAPTMLDRFLRNSRKSTGSTNWTMSTDKIVSEIALVNGMSADAVKQACGKKALNSLASDMKSMAFETYINSFEVGMTDKARVDTKNAGMSIVADLLGVPNVICRAQPVKIKDAKGNIVEGTFMEMARGTDPNSPGREGIRAGKSSLKHTDGRGLESIADLQVLDYICGNVDRHGGNLFYQFDDDGKLIGVQGIDNDSSFGTFTPQLKKDAVRRLPVAPTMGVISKKTADLIMNTSPSELAFALRGTIDEPSIKASCDRLKIMQHVISLSRKQLDQNTRDIKYPYLRELTTEEFANADIKKLTDAKENNHFREVHERLPMIASSARASNEPLSASLVGSENRATEAGIYGQYKFAGQIEKKLKDKTSFFRGSSSQNYKDIEEAVRDYAKLQLQIRKRINDCKKKAEAGDASPDTIFGQYVTGFDLGKMREGLQKMKTAADKYAVEKRAELTGKGMTLEDDKYIKARIELAEEISRYAGEHLNMSADEKATLESNDRRSMEEYVRSETKPERNPQNPNVENNGLEEANINGPALH